MSEFLYKVGSFAARRAWAVIGIWALVIALAGGAYASFKGDLTDSITIPGTEAQLVQEELSDTFNLNLNAGTGSAIVQTEDGSPFTDEQKAAVASAVAETETVEGVDSVTDPFAVAQQLADGRAQLEAGQAELSGGEQQLADGQAQLDAAKAQLDSGQAELDSRRAELDSGQQQLDEGYAQLEDAQNQLNEARSRLEGEGAPPEAFGELNSQQAQLDAQRAQLDATAEQLNQGRTQLDEAQAQLDQGRADYEAGLAQLEDSRSQLESGKSTIEQNAALLQMSESGVAISDDNSTAIISVTFDAETGSIPVETLEETQQKLNVLSDSGLTVTYDQYMQGVEPAMNATAEAIGIGIAFIVLFLMLGTLVAAGLPIIMAVIGVGTSALAVLSLSSVVEMTSTTPTLGTMLGLAVGIDYTLFILNRHRTNLAKGMNVKESIALATGTSGGAVFFAGATVIIALLGLNVVGIPFLGVMGNAGAFAVAVAVAVATTLSPAVMSLLGERVLSKKQRAKIAAGAQAASEDDAQAASIRAEAKQAAADHEEAHRGWIGLILKKPIATVAAVVLALGAVALPVTDMRLGLPTGASQTTDSAAYISYTTIADKFGEGQNGPIVVAARLPEGTTEEQAKALQVEVGQDLLDQSDVSAVIPAMISDDNSALLYQVIPDEGPNAQSTTDLVHALRDMTVSTENGEVTFGVTGQTAMAVDIAQNLAEVLPVYVALVMGLSLLVLILVFRSILVPVTATLGFLFSLLAALGATTAVFQWGWVAELFNVSTPGPLLAFLPILAVGILFGLAMDYQLFLVSGMREAYSHGRGAKTSVVVGYHHGARVVTAAALIMAGVFIGFVFSGDPMIASIGFVLAVGVLLDAFVVRMTLIPALMYLLGEKAWWLPAWLDRLLPDLDVEGTKLEAQAHEEEAAPAPTESRTSAPVEDARHEVVAPAPAQQPASAPEHPVSPTQVVAVESTRVLAQAAVVAADQALAAADEAQVEAQRAARAAREALKALSEQQKEQ
ncbi:MMPL family transporter [Rothia nasimurium]|uniref:MMPL family transporter n=1 Tax=Rothia nasimurium TaxID=85336 RepID=UPI001F0192C2|nr:MMPL family transporter [Rothia nasimurium]